MVESSTVGAASTTITATDSNGKNKKRYFWMKWAKLSSSTSSSALFSSICNNKYSLPAIKPAFFLVFLIICALLAMRWPRLHHSSSAGSSKQSTSSTFYKNNSTNYPKRDEYILNCTSSRTSVVCPANYPNLELDLEPDLPSNETCPEYFRWIHEDLKIWKEKGITKQMVERAKDESQFRVTIVNGIAYVKQHMGCPIDRSIFTLWGILQLLKLYPGRVADVDLMFQCFDFPSITKQKYPGKQSAFAPPVFHYCGNESSFDIAFPDWAFWSWPELNLRPWGQMAVDIKKSNSMKNWTARKPFAYWKGNIYTGDRLKIIKCGSIEEWNAEIIHVSWDKIKRNKFKHADPSKQCRHRYNIYIEGHAWSASRKYILACDAMTLIVEPVYHEFYTRGLVPKKHYWPISPDPKKICKSIKFAVNWGNNHTDKAEEIGKAGSEYLLEQVKMKYVYDYMFHLFNEYAKLLKYKPTVPKGALELCSEKFACSPTGREMAFKIESTVHEPARQPPCNLPPPYEPETLQTLLDQNAKIKEAVEMWENQSE